MNILGTYSGIGMETVDQLIAAEKAKGVQFTNKKDKIEAQQGAWKDIGTRLDSLYSKIEALQNPKNFLSQNVNSNVKNSPNLSVSSNEKAISSSYRMEIIDIASSTQLAGSKVESVDSIEKELDFSGDFSFTNADGKEVKITIETGQSLKDIVETINGYTKDSVEGEVTTEGSGIKASIIDNHLVLTDTKLGERNIEVTDNALANQLGFSTAENNLSATSANSIGQNAKISIDGLVVERDSNQITDAIEGLTINLTAKHKSGDSELITVSHDTSRTVDTVKEFIDQYNSVMDFISRQTDTGDPSAEKNKTGALVGEGSLLRLQSELRSILTRNLKSGPKDDNFNLSELGIEVDRYGKATLDESMLREKVLEDPTNVARAFYQAEAGDVSSTENTGSTTKNKESMSELLKNFVDSYTSSTKGIIKTKQDSYDRMLKDISKQIETFDARIERKRDRYIKQFTALDTAMMQAESQMEYMFSQLGMDNK